MKYRAEIDGLRAVAVVPVILFHGGVAGFSGGFVGVDVFFVISGFLIATIVMRELDAGRFSLAQFYERRARRILPALTFVVAATIPFAWAWMMPDDLGAFARSLFGVATFSSNIVFWQGSGYFDTAAELKPLLHTWSLAVEEQFYIFFPPVLMMLWRFPRRIVIATLAASFVFSLGIAVWGAGHKPDAAFFLLPTRAWELLIGVGCAFGIVRTDAVTDRTASILSLIGLAMLLTAIVTFDASTSVPGLPILLPTLGTALVILYARAGTAAHRLLSWRPFVAIGLVSYSAYLWHQPILALARYRFDPHMSAGTLAVCLALTGALAMMSWAWVERPFRSSSFLDRPRVFRLSGSALAGLSAIGLIGIVDLFDVRTAFFDDLYSDARLRLASPVQAEDASARGNPVILWGDSYADALSGELRESLAPSGYRIVEFHYQACPPILGTVRGGHPVYVATHGPRCASFMKRTIGAIRTLAADPSPPLYVILAGHFSDALEGIDVDGRPSSLDASDPTLPAYKFVPQRLRETVQELAGLGYIPIVVLPHPLFADFHAVIRRGGLMDRTVAAPSETARRHSAHLTAALEGTGTLVIDTVRLFCPDGGSDCPAFIDGQTHPIYEPDGNHLSAWGASRVAAEIAARIGIADRTRPTDTAAMVP